MLISWKRGSRNLELSGLIHLGKGCEACSAPSRVTIFHASIHSATIFCCRPPQNGKEHGTNPESEFECVSRYGYKRYRGEKFALWGMTMRSRKGGMRHDVHLTIDQGDGMRNGRRRDGNVVQWAISRCEGIGCPTCNVASQAVVDGHCLESQRITEHTQTHKFKLQPELAAA
jgi:hypothetical protein